MSVTKAVPQEDEEWEIDLNETAKKQGLMADDEFQSILDGVHRREESANEMAEGLDLASHAVGEGEHSGVANESEGIANQPVEEVKEKQTGEEKESEEERQKSETPQSEAKGGEGKAEEEAEVQPEKSETTTPTVTKLKSVKWKLVLKSDPKDKRQKPRRVSQRWLGKWTSSKAGANTAEDAVEVSSEDERTTPTKPGEEPSTTSQEGTPMATGTVPPTPTDQEEEADKVAEGMDLAPKSVSQGEAIDDNTQSSVVAEPTAQVNPSTPAVEKSKEDQDEDKYLHERKQKRKNPAKEKQVVKKQCTASTSIVIREPEQRRGISDSDYTSSEESESESESDISLDGEEYHEQQLSDNHIELVHPPVERVVYRRWRVELTDEDMVHYNTKKL